MNHCKQPSLKKHLNSLPKIKKIFMVSAVKIEQNLSKNITKMTRNSYLIITEFFLDFKFSDYHTLKCKKSKIRKL